MQTSFRENGTKWSDGEGEIDEWEMDESHLTLEKKKLEPPTEGQFERFYTW